MFTRTELETTVNMVRSKNLFLHQPLTIQSSYAIPGEADLSFFRGARKHYENGAYFWLRCITWLEEYWQGFQLLVAQRSPSHHVRVNFNTVVLMDELSLCKNISPESFQVMIKEYSLQLKNASIPHTYHWEGQVRQAMQMSEQWNNQSFIAETESEFLAFYWETGA